MKVTFSESLLLSSAKQQGPSRGYARTLLTQLFSLIFMTHHLPQLSHRCLANQSVLNIWLFCAPVCEAVQYST